MPFSVRQIDHVEVFVRDLEASVRWYAEVLGLREVCRFEPHPIMIGIGGTMLALFQARGERGANGTSPHWHLTAWQTDPEGFAAAQEHLRELGVPFRGPVDHDIAWSIYFDDPDGNPLEITYYKAAPDGSNPA
jgi:catechol-2,3-dioxygenase